MSNNVTVHCDTEKLFAYLLGKARPESNTFGKAKCNIKYFIILASDKAELCCV